MTKADSAVAKQTAQGKGKDGAAAAAKKPNATPRPALSDDDAQVVKRLREARQRVKEEMRKSSWARMTWSITC